MPTDSNSPLPPENIRFPDYPANSPARLDEESTEAFNEEAASNTFGYAKIRELKDEHVNFCGDWWMLAYLLHCQDHALRTDPACSNPLRFREWNATIHRRNARGVRIHLEHADLDGAYLAYADLHGAYLQRSHLQHAHLNHAHLYMARLDHACLEWANLQHAKLMATQLKSVVFRRARLESANLAGSNLEHAVLEGANMDQTNLRDAEGILFDDNAVERLDIEGKAPDPWSVLRREYTGPMFFVHLLLLVGFLLPYTAKVLALTIMSATTDALRKTLASSGNTLPWAKEVSDWLAGYVAAHKETRAVWVLLGSTKEWAWLFVSTSLAIITYNWLRGYLTLNVGVLRDQADRVQRTPTLEEYYGPCHPLAGEDSGWGRIIPVWWKSIDTWWQGPVDLGGVGSWKWRWDNVGLLSPMTAIGLYRIHCIATVLFWISLASVLFHVGSWIINTTVRV